jgi:hypothetical protein
MPTVEWLVANYGCTRNDYNRTRNYLMRFHKSAKRVGTTEWDFRTKNLVPSTLAWLDKYTRRSKAMWQEGHEAQVRIKRERAERAARDAKKWAERERVKREQDEREREREIE